MEGQGATVPRCPFLKRVPLGIFLNRALLTLGIVVMVMAVLVFQGTIPKTFSITYSPTQTDVAETKSYNPTQTDVAEIESYGPTQTDVTETDSYGPTQTDVAETKSCCMNTTPRNCYSVCRLSGTVWETCANQCGCIIITGTNKCPSDYPKHFCKLGCVSSMCSTINNTLHDFGGFDWALNDIEEAVVGCNNICSKLCNHESSNPVFNV